MPETLALDKHACAACGAEGEWNPARQALVCNYCGTVAPVELDSETGEVRELDYVWPQDPDEAKQDWQPAEPSPIVKMLIERRRAQRPGGS